MENINFTGGLIAGYIIEGILIILIPIVLLMIWRKKTNASLKPVIAGAVIFPLFGLALKMIPVYFLLIADNPVSKAMGSNVWLSAIIGGGLLAGIFEEGGRFVAFKCILKKYTDRKDAVSYGIGHGGIESIYVALNACFTTAVIGFLINSGNTDVLFGNLDENTLGVALEQVRSMASNPVYYPMVFGTLERASAITVHIALSVLVFTAANKKGCGHLFPAAIVLHTVMNGMTGFVNAGILTVVQLELVMYIYAAVLAFFAYRVYKRSDSIPDRQP